MKSQGIKSAKSIRSELGSESRQQVKTTQTRYLCIIHLNFQASASAHMDLKLARDICFSSFVNTLEFLYKLRFCPKLRNWCVDFTATLVYLELEKREIPELQVLAHDEFTQEFLEHSGIYRLNCASHCQNDSHVVILISSL